MARISIRSVNSRLVEQLGRPCMIGKLVRLKHDAPHDSTFGAIRVMKQSEQWPKHRGVEMIPVLQLNTDNLIWRPPELADIAMLRVWVSAPTDGEPLGDAWCVRASPGMTGLFEARRSQHKAVRPCSITWVRDIDPPSYYDLPRSVDDEIAEMLADEQPATSRQTKIGGYPYPMQGEGPYRPSGRWSHEFEYVLQIGSEPRAKWMWGDGGVAFIGRHKKHRDRWEVHWECS